MTVESISTANAWAGVELRHLLALLAVAETGTFSAAAEQLGYTQSAVSQQVSSLERMIGASLFDRPGGPRPVRLTEAGDMLVGHARAVLSRLKTAESDLRAVVAGEQGVLRVGTVQSVGTRVVPDLLRRFGQERPRVEILLRESHDPADLVALVEKGELDVTFSSLPPPDGPFASRWILDDPYAFIAPADAPEASHTQISGEEVADLPLIGYRNDTCDTHIMSWFQELGRAPRFVFRSDDNPTIQGCIAAGLAYGVLPLLTVDMADRGIRVVTIDPPLEPRRLGLVWHAERRPAPSLEAFADAATSVCAELSERWKTSPSSAA